MRVDVRYFTKNGGTKKLADAIAQAVGAEAKTVDQPLEKYADIVFLGSSVYGGKPDPAVVKFIADNAKSIGKLAPVARGKIDAIILTGGIAYSDYFTGMIIPMVDWIAPVTVMPGENEMQSLAEGVLRVLRGEETARFYSGTEEN